MIYVDIVVVNWNCGSLLKKCLASYIDSSSNYLQCNVVISDNGSSDDSLTGISGKNLKIVYNNINLGFGEACNRALPYCKGKYLLLLNPDTESNLENLERLVIKMEQHNDFGSIGPSQLNREAVIQKTCGRFPNLANSVWELTGLSKVLPKVFQPSPIMFDWDHSHSKEVDHVMGSYMLIRKSVIDIIGFMDHDYFMYMEDIDFSLRITAAGYRNYYYSDVSIYHEGGGVSKKVKAHRLFYSLNAKMIYWKKHLKNEYYFLMILGWSIEPLFRTLITILKLDVNEFKETIVAYRMLFKAFMLKKQTNKKY